MLSMSALTSSLSVSVAAHGIHYVIIGAGVVGLVALLVPRFLASPTSPRDEHEARVLALRTAIAAGSPAATFDPTWVAAFPKGWETREPVLTIAQRVLLPLAVVSAGAAAGVHAAVGPAHFREATLFGLFFALAALLQLVWAGAVAVHCSRALLVAGAVGNVALLALWGVTRTIGLPFGLLPEPEALGPWDLACAGWELIVAAGCIALLQSMGPLPTRVVASRLWHPGVHWFVAASVLALVALSLSGASA